MDNNIIRKFEKYCRDEDYNKIEEYLDKYTFLTNYDDGYFFSIIADSDNIELVDLFLKNGGDVKNDDFYVLYKLAENGRYDIVMKLMKDNDIDINVIRYTHGYNEMIKRYNFNVERRKTIC